MNNMNNMEMNNPGMNNMGPSASIENMMAPI